MNIADLKNGQRVTVTYEGTVEGNGRYAAVRVGGRRLPAGLLQSAAKIERRLMEWQIGDVVVIRFNGPGSTPYTYVRDANKWPGITTTLTDHDVTEYVERGLATHLVRAGEVVVQPPTIAGLPGTLRPRPFPF